VALISGVFNGAPEHSATLGLLAEYLFSALTRSFRSTEPGGSPERCWSRDAQRVPPSLDPAPDGERRQGQARLYIGVHQDKAKG
jgi:hypothetical protein